MSSPTGSTGTATNPNPLKSTPGLFLNSLQPLFSNLCGERGDDTSEEQAIRLHTHSIGWYSFAPYPFVKRARAFLNLQKPILAIGDCVRAIRICQIAQGRPVPGLGVVAKVEDVLKWNARFICANVTDIGDGMELAADITKLAEDAGILLMECGRSLDAHPETLKPVLQSVFGLVPQFEARHFIPWSERRIAEIKGEVVSDERKYSVIIQHEQCPYSITELSREVTSLDTVWGHLKGFVDHNLAVHPRPSIMLPSGGAEKSSQPLGMIAATEIPARAIISHDKTDLVIQDTANKEPPYRCENCWKEVFTFGPAGGQICCFHARRPTDNKPYAPTVYCSPICKYENRGKHERMHRVLITSAYEAAAAGNDFPLFVAKAMCFADAAQTGNHPLNLSPLKSTLETYGPQTKHYFSIIHDLLLPWDTLLHLGYNIFGDRRCETWVLLSLKHKWLHNNRVKSGLKMVFPIRAFYNHSCDSNAMVGTATRRTQDGRREVKKPVNEEIVFARKRIQAGEEVTISYIGSGAAKMKKAAREKALRKVGIEVCLCPLCIKERKEAEEREAKRSAKKGWF